MTTYASAIGGVAQQAQHKEEQRQAFAGLFALVLDNLWDARSKIAYCACISEYLGSERAVR